MIEGYLRRLGLMDADGPVDYLDPQRMNLAKSWPTNGAIDSGLNPQMTRPVRSSFPNPADYADEPKSSMRQMIDDARSGKRDDIPALLMAGIENIGTMPLKMMTLEGMHGLTQDMARAIATPYNVLTSSEPVTTEQMIEPAANIALTAPLGGLAAGRMAPVELSQGKEEARGLLGLLQQSDPYGRDYLSPVGQGDMPDVIATDPRLYPTPAPAPDRNASMLERYMPQSMIEWGSSVKAAQGKPTLFGKMLGAVGLDESGRRGQTSWSDAAKSTMYLPGELVEGLIGSGRNLANYEGGAYHTSPEAADRARASQLTGDVFNVAGALPMGAAGMSAAGRMAPVERVAYSNSKEGALPGLLSGAGQKQGTSATVTTAQMIEPAANIALTAPMGGAVAGRMAPKEMVAFSNSKEGAVPGLLMDEASRMQRAREMGFDTGKTLYHGTGKDFEAFDPGTRGNGTRRNIYLTDRPEIADIYANSENYGLKGGGNPAIYPVYAKAEKPLVVSDKGPDGSFGWVHDNLEAALGVKARGARGYASLYDEARRQGYDQVQIREMIDLGGEQTQYIPLKPENIRSKFAAFDPAKRDSANLLASNPEEAAPLSLLSQGKDTPQGITAYHGSPHDFDRFSMDKIGTGEGAQAYGHGLYFAENEGTAKSYRDTLAHKGATPELLADVKQRLGITTQDEAATVYRKSQEDGDPLKLALSVQMMHSNLRDPGSFMTVGPKREAIAAEIQRLRDATSGHMYEVRINAEPEHFLDWDKPRDQLSPKLQEWAAANHPDVWDKAADGASFYKHLQDKMTPPLPPDPPGTPKGWGFVQRGDEGQPRATQALRDAGIPGIRYLDQGSRTAGEGSRNFVVFDDKLISIVRKYGWAGAAAMLGMSADDLMAQAQAAEQQPVKPDPYREALRMKARAKALGINP